mgnify:CR=1 FL=1
MSKKEPSEKKSRGRPAKLPPGEQRNVRCILVNGEMTKLREAMAKTGQSQTDLSRAALLHAVDCIISGQRPPYDPGSAAFPLVGEVGAGLPQLDSGKPAEWFRPTDHFPADAKMFRVRGNSMTGYGIHDLDWIIVRDASAADHGQRIVAGVDDGLTLKKLEIVPKGERKGYWLTSYGPEKKPPIQLSGFDDRRIVGVLVGVVRKC